MAEIAGHKMSEYTSVDTLTPEQKSAFLDSAAVTVFGTDPEDASAKANYSVPLSEITPSPAVPTKLSDLTDDITTSEYSASGTAPVDGTAVAAALGGLATVASTGNYSDLNGVPTIPTAGGLAGDGLEEASGKLKVVTKVPSPGTNEHRGDVLTVDDSDQVVWDAVSVSQPTYGEGLEYNETTNTLKFSYLGSGGLTYEQGPGGTRGMKVKAGNGIKVDNAGVSIENAVPTPRAEHADVGKVLTIKTIDNTDEIVWDAPQGGFPPLPSDYSSKDYFLHINKTNGTIEWALAAS